MTTPTNRKADTFVFPPELGSRLKELRKQAGLTIAEMSRRMGRGKGFPAHLSLLERGKVRFPSLAIIADWLRVCHASAAELVPFIDAYAAQASPLEVEGRERVRELTSKLPAKIANRLERYDIKTTLALRYDGKPPLESDEREMRIRKQAAAWIERGRLDRPLNAEVMEHLGVDALSGVRKYVFDYAHRLWRILKRTRAPEGGIVLRRGPSREELLDAAEQKAVADDFVPLAGLRLVRAKTVQVFEEMERNREFGFLPTTEQARLVPKPFSLMYRKKKGGDGDTPIPQSGPDYKLLSTVANLAGAQVEAEGIAQGRFRDVFLWLFELGPIGLETKPGSPERAERVKAHMGQSVNTAMLTRVAEIYFEVFEHWRPRLFPHGEPGSTPPASPA